MSKGTKKDSPLVESAKAVASARHELELANADLKKKEQVEDTARDRAKAAQKVFDDALQHHASVMKEIK